MQPGIHYNETFAPVVQITTLRIMLVLMTMYDWTDWQGDAPSAFMQPKMDSNIFILPSAALRYHHAKLRALEAIHGIGKVAMKLLKGLPGIPQGSRLWNTLIHKVLTAIGFTRSKIDYGLYYRKTATAGVEHTIFILIWVDDLFSFFHESVKDVAMQCWNVLRKQLKLEAPQPINDCLGCVITRDRKAGKTFLTQEPSVKALQRKLGLEDVKGHADTPMDANLKISRDECPNEAEQMTRGERIKRYQSVVASFIYFAMWTRPDISFAVGYLARFMHNPPDSAEKALKRLVRYVFDTANFGLCYDFSKPDEAANRGIYGYYDSSFADCPDTRKSTGGHILFWYGCPVAWVSKLHPYVTTSTDHSEYVAGAICAREAIFQSNLATEIGMEQPTIHLWSDSKGCISQCYNPVNRKNSKHVDLADHYIREQVERKRITVSYTNTKDMVADIFTKPLPRVSFSKLSGMFMAAEI